MPQLAMPSVWKRQVPPVLEESPYQKVFVESLEEFEASLIKVGCITLAVIAIGIFAYLFCHCLSAIHLSLLGILLCLNWFIGYLASYRTRKDLANL
jgi:uncharacterized RDD family membrane protein YckC